MRITWHDMFRFRDRKAHSVTFDFILTRCVNITFHIQVHYIINYIPTLYNIKINTQNLLKNIDKAIVYQLTSYSEENLAFSYLIQAI